MDDAVRTAASRLVLVADDDTTARSAMVAMLQEAGYRTEEATDGETALHQALEYKPDLILTDNRMPVLNGGAMVERLRQDAWGATVPVVILTSHYSLEAMNESLSAGSKTDFLIKDETSLDDILTVIRRWLAA